MPAIFTSPYLNVSAVKGKHFKATITKIITEEVGRDKEEKLVAYFDTTPLGLILSTPVKKCLIDELETNDTDEMVGQTVEIFVDPDVKVSNNRVGGVRLRKAK